MGGRGSKGHSSSRGDRGSGRGGPAGATAGRADAAGQGAASTATVIQEQLAMMSTRAEAAEYLDRLQPSKAALLAAARELDIAVYDRDTVADLKQVLIHATVGAREDAEAIRNWRDTTPEPAQDVPDQQPGTAPADMPGEAAPVWDAAQAVNTLRQQTSAKQATADLQPLTKAKLRDMAEDMGLKGVKGMSKDDLIHSIVYQAITGPRTLQRAQEGDPPKPAPVVPAFSDNPRKPNTWGGYQEDGAHTFHPDGVIGDLIGQPETKDLHGKSSMIPREELALKVRGDSLENVLGDIATETMAGRISPQQQLDELKAIAAELPAGRAKSAISRVVADLDVPRVDLSQRLTPQAQTALDRFPVIRTLLNDLNEIPLARGADIPGDVPDTREIDRIADALDRFGRGELGGNRFIRAIESADNARHESREGKAAIDRAVQKTLHELWEIHKADRETFYPTKPQ